MLHDIIQFRNHDKETDRLSLIVSKIQQIRIKHRLQSLEQHLHLLLIHSSDTMHVQIPRLIINDKEGIFRLPRRHLPVGSNPVIFILQQPLRLPNHHFGKTLHHEVSPVNILLKIITEPVIFKKRDIILMRVRHLKYWRLETVHQQTPPLVTLPEIHRPFHGLHASFLQPCPTTVEQHESGLLIINTLEETHPPYRIRIQMTRTFINKRGHTPHALFFFIPQQPTGTLAMVEKRILPRVEYLCNVII